MLVVSLSIVASLWLMMSTVLFRSHALIMAFYAVVGSLAAGASFISLSSRWSRVALFNVPLGLALISSPAFIYHENGALVLNSLAVGLVLVAHGFSAFRWRRYA